MHGFDRDSDAQGFREINVTPLVDVMLVLLIVFMVTAPLIQQGVEVKLPQAQAQPLKSEDEKLVLSVRKFAQLTLAATAVWALAAEGCKAIAATPATIEARARERRV